MSRIESPSNPRIAAAVRAVAEGDRMLLEGKRIVEEALDAGIALEDLFVVDEISEEHEDLLRRVRGEGAPGDGGATPAGGATPPPRVTEVSARVLKRLSDLPSTRGVAAIAPPPRRTLSSLYSPSKKSSSSNVPRSAGTA